MKLEEEEEILSRQKRWSIELFVVIAVIHVASHMSMCIISA